MSKKYISMVPASIANTTIGELLNSENIEIHKKGNSISMRTGVENSVVSLTINQYESGGNTYHGTVFPTTPKKKDLIKDIRKMKKEGIKQKDIAFQLGISPGYVTQLLKKDK